MIEYAPPLDCAHRLVCCMIWIYSGSAWTICMARERKCPMCTVASASRVRMGAYCQLLQVGRPESGSSYLP